LRGAGLEAVDDVNDQWRICFVWKESGADLVEIVDYH